MEKPKVNTINRLLRKLSSKLDARIMLKGSVLSVLVALGILPFTLRAVDGVSLVFDYEISDQLLVNDFTDTVLLIGSVVPSDGEGLYEKVCGSETFYHVSTVIDFISGLPVLDSTPYDSLVCRLVPIKGKYPITHCDSVWHLLSVTVDSFPVSKESQEQEDGKYKLVDVYHYDTIREYAFEVHCRQIDTSYCCRKEALKRFSKRLQKRLCRCHRDKIAPSNRKEKRFPSRIPWRQKKYPQARWNDRNRCL